ncbi:hypothetical protein CVU14613_00450 [Campylobacter vulpis]|nr:restriction endonuclease subunit S [Campylobacter vulpis]MBS4234808.1 hypothetical protein [Campylobacter vulpis]
MTNTNDLKALLDSIPTPPAQGWKVEKISQIVEKLSAGGDKPKVFSESKTQECQVPIYANAVEKQGLYGYTDKPTITQNALTISARGTIGYAVARYEPFCPIVRLIVLIPKANKANLKFLEVVINNIEIEQSGVNIPQLTVPQFSNLKIPLPPLEAQEKIISAIESVENKIAAIDSKLEILEKRKAEVLANALNAGNEREREREQAELKEILSEIESLLSQRKILQRFITKILQKAELTQSIHSLIASLPTPPKHGWERVRLGQVSQVIAGQSPQSQFYNDRQEGLLFFQGKKDFGEKYLQNSNVWTSQITKESVKNDILMSVRSPVGDVNLNPYEKICIGRGLAAIRAENYAFLFYCILHNKIYL